MKRLRAFFRWIWGGFASLGEGFASIGEGMASLLDPYPPPKALKGRKKRAEFRREAARADIQDARERLAETRARLKQVRQKQKKLSDSVFTSDYQPLGVEWQPFNPRVMTERQKERLIKLGFSAVEVEALAALELPPLVEAMFVALLISARGKVKARSYPWWRDLGLEQRPASREEARSAYSKAMLKAHPDHGGDAATMAKVRAAWERAQQEFPGGTA